MIGITPNAIHICPPLSLRECKSGLKSLLLLYLATMIQYLSGGKARSNFSCSLTYGNPPWPPLNIFTMRMYDLTHLFREIL